MTYIALTLPGETPIPIPTPPGLSPGFDSLGSILTRGFSLVLFLAGFLMLFWVTWGIFQYIFAGGAKEGLAQARARITWAIVGFLLLVFGFAVSQYVENIFPHDLDKGVQKIIVP